MTTTENKTLDILAIKSLLPHRYPLLLVDRVLTWESGKTITAIKNVTVNEEFFQGHFPGTPLMPGVLMIETLAQVATLLLVHGPDGKPSGHAYLRGVDDAKFRRQVVPGDRLRLEVTLGARRSKLARAHAVHPSRLAHGVPLGGELEYVDRGTLSHAFGSRSEIPKEPPR